MPCEQNILDLSLNSSLIDPNEVVIFTLPDGTSVLRKWSVILGAITPADIEFQVGVTPGAPSDGDPTYTNAALIGKRIRVFRQFLKQTVLPVTNGYSYSFDNSTGVLTPSPAFADGEIWSIEIY